MPKTISGSSVDTIVATRVGTGVGTIVARIASIRLSGIALLAGLLLGGVAMAAEDGYAEWPAVAELHTAMREGELTSAVLVERQIARIELLNPELNAVIAIDPTARAQARALDARLAAGDWAGPLHGIPVLLKDNIETRDQPTTAGSLALADNVTGRDAPLVARLRAAGAVILGKANLSEWANFRSERSSSGWSGVGGQTRNAYDPTRSPCGSSSGSGVAVAAGMTVLAVGTETNGSIVCPSSANGIVGIKPTVGLVSRTHIVPISHSQDTAGPMARSVHDAVVLLAAMAGPDEADPATAERPAWSLDHLPAHLGAGGLEGKRIGALRSSAGFHSEVDELLEAAIVKMREGGAEIIDEIEWQAPDDFFGKAYDVLLYEFKHDLNTYLAGLPDPDLSTMTLADLIEFNRDNAAVEMPWFDQEIFEQAQAKGPLDDEAYREALSAAQKAARADGIDKLLAEHGLDALIAPTGSAAWTIDLINGDHFIGGSSSLAAISGYPNITVPMGQVHGMPVGLSIFGAKFSEPALIEIASGFEHAAGGFRPPVTEAP
ncbi:MAG: amidase [Xanthomonadales bacterium]|nr:amidase [Xanthomonadales bacterium]